MKREKNKTPRTNRGWCKKDSYFGKLREELDKDFDKKLNIEPQQKYQRGESIEIPEIIIDSDEDEVNVKSELTTSDADLLMFPPALGEEDFILAAEFLQDNIETPLSEILTPENFYLLGDGIFDDMDPQPKDETEKSQRLRLSLVDYSSSDEDLKKKLFIVTI